jgi:hypothetical protein
MTTLSPPNDPQLIEVALNNIAGPITGCLQIPEGKISEDFQYSKKIKSIKFKNIFQCFIFTDLILMQ